MSNYVLDTSALMALRNNEQGASRVEKILKESSSQIYVSFMTFMEMFYWSWRQEGKTAAHKTIVELKCLPIEKVDLNDPLLFLAGEVKASYSMSLADSWIAATAIQKKAILVHKDAEYDPLKDKIKLEKI
jgi:predicted nucleic acid-binding protein